MYSIYSNLSYFQTFKLFNRRRFFQYNNLFNILTLFLSHKNHNFIIWGYDFMQILVRKDLTHLLYVAAFIGVFFFFLPQNHFSKIFLCCKTLLHHDDCLCYLLKMKDFFMQNKQQECIKFVQQLLRNVSRNYVCFIVCII